MKTKFLLITGLLCMCGFTQVKAQDPLKVEGFDDGVEHLAQGQWNAGINRSVIQDPADASNYILNLAAATLEWGRVAAFNPLSTSYDPSVYRYLVFDAYRSSGDIKVKAKFETGGETKEISPIYLSQEGSRWERLVFDFKGVGASGQYSQMQIILDNMLDGSENYVNIDNIYYSSSIMVDPIIVSTSPSSPTILNSMNGQVGQGNEVSQASNGFFGNWEEGDYLYWNITVPSGYNFAVTGSNAVDVDAAFVVDLVTEPATQTLTTTYDFDSSWEPYNVTYGDLALPAGDYKLKLVPDRAASGGWKGMNLYNITFTPTNPTGNQSPEFNSDDEVIETRYYNLQGIEVKEPANNGAYIAKKIYKSQKTETVKIFINK